MKTLLLSSFLLLNIGALRAQTKVTGFIKTTKGNSVANASISIKNSYDGTSSDSTGHFSFLTAEKGKQLLIFSTLNFNRDLMEITLEGKVLSLNPLLKDAVKDLKTVTISAGTYTTGDLKKGAVLSSIDIATLAGSRADVIAAMQTLPGAQAAGSEGGLFVRGGTAAETKTYLDGMLVKSLLMPPYLIRLLVAACLLSCLKGHPFLRVAILRSTDRH
ncbi:carboxypeptidase-like regulatory domain-containing protein [Pedobacter aquatilis]|uniref:carboxypeptidase-like regulatory domain-containing protein n=1 Tax=Pedobacter aquatilis TaxID=351343 RepID=UPI00292CC4DF|nr:carboxypeptidase-like regulatory domain-containing protein [Pedobacter aquatilis]